MNRKKGKFVAGTQAWNKGLKGFLAKEKHYRWKGGERTDRGYIYVLCESHPYTTKSGYVRKHRLVMERHLGRVLLPTERVHHINGIKNDNRIENLMLFSDESMHQKSEAQKRKRDSKGRLTC